MIVEIVNPQHCFDPFIQHVSCRHLSAFQAWDLLNDHAFSKCKMQKWIKSTYIWQLSFCYDFSNPFRYIQSKYKTLDL